MKPIIVIDENLKQINNPFVLNVVKEIEEYSIENIYIIRRIDSFDFSEIDYFDKKITSNIYWSESESDIDELIFKLITEQVGYKKIKTVYESKSFGMVYYYENKDSVYLLDTDENVYYYNKKISKELGIKITIEEKTTFESLLPKMICLGMVGERASLLNFDKYKRMYNEYFFLFLIKMIYNYKSECDLVPYENIIKVEKYLNKLRYDENIIDFKRLEEYNLDYCDDILEFNNYGLFTKTGRIFQSSNNGFNLQTLPNKYKDVLRVLGNSKILLEIDFVAFEYNLLCQILGLPIVEDPHTKIFEELIGECELGFEEKRNIGKQINYAVIFGSSKDSIIKLILSEIGDLDTQKLTERVGCIDILNEREEMKDELKKEIESYGYITNYFGRKVVVEKNNAEVNYFVQSSASDFFYSKFVKIIKLFEDCNINRVLLQRFDSYLLELKNDSSLPSNIIEIVKILTESEFGLTCKFKVSKGNNWKNLN